MGNTVSWCPLSSWTKRQGCSWSGWGIIARWRQRQQWEDPQVQAAGCLGISLGCSGLTVACCLALITAHLCRSLVGSVQAPTHLNTFKLNLSESYHLDNGWLVYGYVFRGVALTRAAWYAESMCSYRHLVRMIIVSFWRSLMIKLGNHLSKYVSCNYRCRLSGAPVTAVQKGSGSGVGGVWGTENGSPLILTPTWRRIYNTGWPCYRNC